MALHFLFSGRIRCPGWNPEWLLGIALASSVFPLDDILDCLFHGLGRLFAEG